MRLKAISFEHLQYEWYAKLKSIGFDDIEDYTQKDRPLKKWTGIAIVATEFLEAVSGDPVLMQEEHFLNHPDFDEFCKMICLHGNMSLAPKTLRLVWIDYCNGGSQRVIAAKYKTSDSTILRVIRKIREAMNLMGEEIEKVYTRSYRPETDAAFLFSSWRNALWFDQKRPDSESEEFYKKSNRDIKIILRLSNVKIAYPSNDENHIIGYSASSGDNLEWVYIKPEYRCQGIARLLTRGFKTVAEPRTKVGTAIVKERNLKIKEKHGQEEQRESAF
jgi:ribosomal protein S18 acetylase RimI-like enzyme